jgi:glycerate kinase
LNSNKGGWSGMEITIACDVQKPLLGANGASRIYGPQKGLREEDMAKAEACLKRLADLVGLGIAEIPGTGAAGGLGFGVYFFMNGKFVPGAEVFAQAARLDERLPKADLVISGEGAIDIQSLMGKGVGELFERARKANVKRLGLAGSLAPGVTEKFGADPNLKLFGIVPTLTNLNDAKANAAHWLAALAAQAAQKYG